MSEDYATELAGQIGGGVATIVITLIGCYWMRKYVDRKLAQLETK